MGSRPKLSLVVGGLCVGLLSIGQAKATTFPYSGTLSSDDQVQLLTYNLAQASTVTFSTSSYAAGGFVPVLSLFNSTGTVLGSDGGDATCYAGMGMDATTHMCDDAYLKQSLSAGSYTLAVTEFFNVPVGPNMSDGFLMQGTGDYTGSTCGTSGGFYETDIAPCVQRNNSYSVDVSSAATATPEPATIWLGAIPLVLFGIARRRNSRTQN